MLDTEIHCLQRSNIERSLKSTVLSTLKPPLLYVIGDLSNLFVVVPAVLRSPICQCPILPETEEEAAARHADEPAKCSVSGSPNCPILHDAISQMVAWLLTTVAAMSLRGGSVHNFACNTIKLV